MVDYFSFEDVMSELELSEEDLKRMVSEGELRAFRDENKMKFKKEDVENLKKGRITEPTIILPSTPGGGQSEETILDLDIGQETAALSDTSASAESVDISPAGLGEEPALEFSETDLSLSEDTEPEIGIESDETFIEEEIDTGLTTEPLQLADETVEAAAVDDEITEAAAPVGRRGRGATRMTRRVTATIPANVEDEIEAKRAHPIWTFILLMAFGFSAFSGIFFYDLMRNETGKADRPLNLTAGIANFILEKFWGDPEWTQFHQREYPDKKTPPYETPAGYATPDWYTGASFEKPDELKYEGGP